MHVRALIRNYSIYYTMNLHLPKRMNRGQVGLSDDAFFVNLKCMAYIHVQDLQRIASSRNEQLCKSAQKFSMDQIILTKFIGMVILHINLSDFFFSFIDKVYEEQLKQTFTCNYSFLRVFMKLS